MGLGSAAKLVAVVGTVPVAIAEPRAWDTHTIQWAAQLAFWAGLGPAVEKILIVVRAVIHDVTRGGASIGYLSTTLFFITAIRAVLVNITTPDEGQAAAIAPALEVGGRARACAGAWGLGRGPGLDRSRGDLQAQPEAEKYPQPQA